ncbi:jg16643 [Pararge aegeria aegeria]|uniref:Jg16643 protein n=1 Tax=Pararge aegeria aegeria TaxID=348720 RepID=A0A8S4RAU5_9NEOP|nr:jg16643 [Pararge aegeria aegeria]
MEFENPMPGLGPPVGILFDMIMGVPQSTVPGRLPPSAPSNSPDVVCLPRWGLTYAAFTGAGPFQHLKIPTSIGPPSYVPGPLPSQRDFLSYVGNCSSSTDLFISDFIT